MSFIEKKFIKFYLGNKKIHSHLDAVHAYPPKADEFTDIIVKGVLDNINCSGIISTVSRTVADLNRTRNTNNEDAINEYRQTIEEILEHLNILNKNGKLSKPYLHLSIHGMKDRDSEIEIGTLNNKTCSPEVKKWLVSKIKEYKKKVQIDEIFPGDSSKLVHRCGEQRSNSNYLGYGNSFNTFQIEINRTLRKNQQKGLIKMLSDIVICFNREFK